MIRPAPGSRRASRRAGSPAVISAGVGKATPGKQGRCGSRVTAISSRAARLAGERAGRRASPAGYRLAARLQQDDSRLFGQADIGSGAWLAGPGAPPIGGRTASASSQSRSSSRRASGDDPGSSWAISSAARVAPGCHRVTTSSELKAATRRGDRGAEVARQGARPRTPSDGRPVGRPGRFVPRSTGHGGSRTRRVRPG